MRRAPLSALLFTSVAAACGAFDASRDGPPSKSDADAPDGSSRAAAPAADASTANDGSIPPMNRVAWPVLLHGRILSIASDGDRIYFADREGADGHVHSVTLAGDLEDITLRAGAVINVAAADGHVYWTNEGGVWWRKKGESLAVNIAPAEFTLVAAAGERVFYASAGGVRWRAHGGIELAPGHVYTTITDLWVHPATGEGHWCDAGTGTLWYVQPNDETAIVAHNVGACSSIAANGTMVFWSAGGAVRQSIAGTAPLTLPGADNEQNPHSLAVDDSGLYWLVRENAGNRGIVRHFRTATTNVATSFNVDARGIGEQAIVLTPSSVVWVTTQGLMQHPKP